MPELPEVESIKRGLRSLQGRTFKRLRLHASKRLDPSMTDRLPGRQIETITRRGKLLIFHLDGQEYLLIHLKMTGQLVYRPRVNRLFVGGHPIVNVADVPNRFTLATFYFDDDSILYFNDVRKFGYIKLVTRSEVDDLRGAYGPEPLSRSLSDERWLALMRDRTAWTVKKFLLDQETVAGVGNIYTDEACFYTGIRPDRTIGSLKHKQKKDLLKNLRYVLRLSIKYGGTSFNTYVQAQGHQGGFYDLLRVYGRKGLPCKVCGRTIERIVVAGRGTHFCPRCQK